MLTCVSVGLDVLGGLVQVGAESVEDLSIPLFGVAELEHGGDGGGVALAIAHADHEPRGVALRAHRSEKGAAVSFPVCKNIF